MLEELAIVVKTDLQQTWVTSTKQSACGGCLQKAACTTHVLGNVLKRKPVLVDNHLPLAIGDHVLVSIEESHLLGAALTLYLLPLLVVFLGVGLADSILAGSINADSWLAVSALISLLLALLFIKRIHSNWLPRPTVSKKITPATYECLGD